jgi:hypothetical protein
MLLEVEAEHESQQPTMKAKMVATVITTVRDRKNSSGIIVANAKISRRPEQIYDM